MAAKKLKYREGMPTAEETALMREIAGLDEAYAAAEEEEEEAEDGEEDDEEEDDTRAPGEERIRPGATVELYCDVGEDAADEYTELRRAALSRGLP